MLRTFAFCCVLLTLGSIAYAVQRTYGVYSEAGIRRLLRHNPMPEYSADAIAAKAQGRVVVAVLFHESGRFEKCAVLDAPDPSIKEAIAKTLNGWTTEIRGDDDGPVKLLGWLSFDCTIENGQGRIKLAEHSDSERSPDKRFIHPFATGTSTPIYYYYEFGEQ